MASLNPSDIITTLKSGNYPYELQFYERRQRFVIYPSVEVVKTKPDSRTSNDPTKYTVSSAFEIKLYIKFTRSENAEETDRAKIENGLVISEEQLQDYMTSAQQLDLPWRSQ